MKTQVGWDLKQQNPAFQCSSVWTLIYDSEGNYIHANPSFHRLLGISKNESLQSISVFNYKKLNLKAKQRLKNVGILVYDLHYSRKITSEAGSRFIYLNVTVMQINI